MYSLSSTLVWIRRIGNCRGFGVQSPWAYSFIRYVVNEHYPYYAYSDLEHSVRDISRKTRKLCRLYFRISNYCRASLFVDYAPATDAYKRYVEAGCRHTRVLTVGGDGTPDEYRAMFENCGTVKVVRMTLGGNWREFYRQVRSRAVDGTFFIIEGIKHGGEARRFWREIVNDEGCTLTFDLYYCGIVYFDKKRYKQNYIVNF